MGINCSFSQETGAFQKFPEGVKESEYAPVAPGQGKFQAEQVMPPSWFVNLPTRDVDVLIYDEGIGTSKASDWRIEGSGVQLLGAEPFPNDNYVKLKLLVEASAKTGAVSIVNGQRRYAWSLTEARQPKALRPSDLIYLIMPDRFANGDPRNDVVAGMTQHAVDRKKVLFRHGGDLQGATRHLDYLQTLGVTAVWFNPVLENDQPYESYHGYAATDHYQIDPRFGGNTAYQTFIDSAHTRGIKVLMDMVPNHAGDGHFLYADMPSRDWWHLPDSFQRSNFRIPSVLDPHAAPEDARQMMDGWFDRHMPDFNQGNPDVRRYFTQMALWWIGATGQDGYRVDTYPYSDPAFMAEWSTTIKQNFPTAAFFGEVWVDGFPHQAAFVPGFDAPVEPGGNPAVTDFQVNWALMEALQRPMGWVEGVGKLWLTLSQDYLYAEPNAQITFLDNHDQSRLATSLGGDENKIKSAISLLLTLRGTPMLYYGTEIGLEGSGGGFGEGGRVDMPGGWSRDVVSVFSARGLSPKRTALLAHTRRLGTFRRDNPDLFEGKMTHYVPENGLYVFFREGEAGRKLMVVYNSSEDAQALNLNRFASQLKGFAKASNVLTEQTVQGFGERLNLQRKQTLVFLLQP